MSHARAKPTTKRLLLTCKPLKKKGDLTVAKEFDQFSDLYASANVQWCSVNTYVIFSPANGKGYIKMFDNGKYVFRYYPVNQEGIMSLGMCQ